MVSEISLYVRCLIFSLFTAIQNSLQCMRSYVDPIVQMYFEICESSSAFLLSLVNDTLDYAQMQAGKFKINFEPVYIQKLVSEVY